MKKLGSTANPPNRIDDPTLETDETGAHLKQPYSFGTELYRLRVSQGLTQVAAARLCGLTRGYYSQLENSKRFPPPSRTLERFVKAFRLSSAQAAELKALAETERSARFQLPWGLTGEIAELLRKLLQRARHLNAVQLRELIARI